MDKGERFLWISYLRDSITVTLILLAVQFAPTLLVAYLTDHVKDYWFITVVWILSVQLTYFHYISYKQLKQHLFQYKELMQTVKDELDIFNTELSLSKEKEVGPN